MLKDAHVRLASLQVLGLLASQKPPLFERDSIGGCEVRSNPSLRLVAVYTCKGLTPRTIARKPAIRIEPSSKSWELKLRMEGPSS